MKKNIGKKNALYPMPIAIVGTEAEGKPTFLTIAHVGIMDHTTLSISSGKIHYSNQWIKKNGTLSINIPSMDMAEKMDYVGTVSGAKVDKTGVFETVKGALEGAPLIKDAPISIECKVIDVYDRPEFDVFICSIENTYVKDEVLTNGKIDYAKVDPILYDMPMFGYWHLGARAYDAYRLSKGMRDADKAAEE